jgi:hypothetical protein
MEWPRPNEKLIRSEVDWQHNACVDCTTPTLGSYAVKFKAAADVLVREAAAGEAMLDEMIIPIVFLYRHYIELTLKEIIMFGRDVVGTGKGFPTKRDEKPHNLKGLWDEVLTLLTAHYGAAIPAEADNVTSCIEDLDAHDPNSFSFRYPSDKNGKPYLTGIRHINIRNLYKTMDRLASFLDCISIDLGTAYEYVVEQRKE